ncbi:unnamed protein product [Prorocentrum cordatum]|uniref:Uncharacterized protein n=1 Tax=Prorocentrum cordatum TaxID=2364126 RepID=A0ABN9X374_9DINO|nr:unnamed protein product [Polarella glacialis]
MRPESPRQKAAARTEEKAPTTGGEPQRAEPARSVTAIHVCHSSTLAPSLARYARQARGVPAPSQGIRADLQTFIPMQRFVARRLLARRATGPGERVLPASRRAPRAELPRPHLRCVGFVLQPHLERGGPTAGRAAQTEDHSPGSAAGSVPQPRTEIE